jgi:hypothetical protein
MTKKATKPPVDDLTKDAEFEEVQPVEVEPVEVPPEPPTFRESKVAKHLQCKLTELEYRTMGQELARANAQAEDVEMKKKAIDADLKGQIEAHVSHAMTLSRTINNGYQYKDVDCVMRFDYLSNVVVTTRLDTGEVIDSRAMTTEERQVELKFEEEEKEEPVESESTPS